MRNSILRKVLISLLILSVCVVATFCMSSCKKDEDVEIKSIEIRKGSFKATYTVDEVIDLANVSIVVTYTNGNTDVVRVTADMLEGFDTSTVTSISAKDPEELKRRKMRVHYNGLYTSYWEYTVISEYTVTTKSRIELAAVGTNDYRVSASLYLEGVEKVYAVSFTVTYDHTLLVPKDTFLETAQRNWEYETYEFEEETRILFYAIPNAEPITAAGRLFSLNFASAGIPGAVKLSNIQLSDRSNTVYCLPDATA